MLSLLALGSFILSTIMVISPPRTYKTNIRNVKIKYLRLDRIKYRHNILQELIVALPEEYAKVEKVTIMACICKTLSIGDF